MSANAELEISRTLEAGESLIRTGVPKQGLVLRAADAFVIPFFLLWCGLVILWEKSVLTTGGPWFLALFGVPFVLVGLYFVFGRFLLDARLRATTFYGLTNRRVIIVSGLFSRTTHSLALRTLHDTSVLERADRSGTVIFGRPRPFSS